MATCFEYPGAILIPVQLLVKVEMSDTLPAGKSRQFQFQQSNGQKFVVQGMGIRQKRDQCIYV